MGNADLLEAAGVDTVPELAQRKAENLHAIMKEVNDQKKTGSCRTGPVCGGGMGRAGEGAAARCQLLTLFRQELR
jgi:hypothetical protein